MTPPTSTSAVRILAVVAALLGVLAVAPAGAAGPVGPFDPPDVGSQLIGCDRAGARVTVTASSHLDPSCTYTAGFDITASDVVLDCQGALVSKVGSGVGIEISTSADTTMSGVTVRNCRVQGFLNSIRATRIGFRQLAAGHEFDHTLHDVVVEDSELSGSRGVGMYVDGYVSGVTLRNLDIHGAGSTGIYLEAGSKGNTVVDNDIHDNGFKENGPDGELYTLGGQQFRFWGTGREGLAIDGSFDNTVAGNRFAGNAAGGIFVYTNCGEYVTQNPGRWYERRYGAERNLIEGNRFEGGLNGVWVGSRMGENTYPMECSQPAYATGPVYRVVLDRAANNTVRGNTFDEVTYGVRVEDDGTTVVGNTFTASDDSHHAVVVGTRVRTAVLGRPVVGTTVQGNSSTIVGNRHPYRWVHGHEATTFDANTSLGQEVGLCEGRTLPYNALIFVLAAVLEPVGSPPTPAPDLTVPTLGSLPPCDPAVPPTVRPGGASIVEGDAGSSIVEVPVTLSEPTVDTVTVEWTTLPGGFSSLATLGSGPGGDVVPASGTVTFRPGQVSATVPVEVLGDVVAEPDESFVVSLRGATGARVGGFYGLATVAVVDDDLPRVVAGTATAAEGAGTVAVPVTLNRPSAGTVTVSWSTVTVPGAPPGQATPGSDHTDASGIVVFDPGEQTAWIDVPLLADDVPEGDEYVVVALARPVGAAIGGFWGLGIATITD